MLPVEPSARGTRLRRAAVIAGSLLAIACSGPAGSGREAASGEPVATSTVGPPVVESIAGSPTRNVVLFIADGMGPTHVAAARLVTGGAATPLGLERLPVHGTQTTHSAGGHVTDSAASATAMSTGVKTDNGVVGQSPDGRPGTTIAELALAAGRPVGIVTDSYLWDATPAAFVAHVARRSDGQGIVEDMAGSGATLLIGADDTGGEEIGRLLTAGGYTVHRSLTDVPEDANGGWVVLQPDDRPIDLADATRRALDALDRSGAGFFLMVETEQVDTSSHGHDLDGAIRGIRDLDAAVAVALQFAETDPATTIVVTSDHETGGLTLLDTTAGAPLRIHWSTSGHTGVPVPVYAAGPGAEAFSGPADNTHLFFKTRALMGL